MSRQFLKQIREIRGRGAGSRKKAKCQGLPGVDLAGLDFYLIKKTHPFTLFLFSGLAKPFE
jgi:hypothetical protein